jgi:predicted transcriptional regulator
MAQKTTPLTFNIDADTVAAIDAFKDRTHSESTSAIIRAAIERFDFDQLNAPAKEAKQISLRIDPAVRNRLKSVAKAQGVSVGFILRECIMNFVSEDQVNPQPRVGQLPTIKFEQPTPEEPDNPWQI